MTVRLVVLPSAIHDIADADAHYARFEKADAFLGAVDQVFTQIAERPLMYPLAYGSVHRAFVRSCPYSVFFIVVDEQAMVLAVHHQRRDPESRPLR